MRAFIINQKNVQFGIGSVQCERSTWPTYRGPIKCPTLQEPGKLLSRSQISRLLSTLNAPKSYSALVSSCFDPHHLFEFYRRDTPVASVAVCFLCSGISSTPLVPAQTLNHGGNLSQRGYDELAALVVELGYSPHVERRDAERRRTQLPNSAPCSFTGVALILIMRQHECSHAAVAE